MAALEGQRGVLGDDVVEVALAPLRARVAALDRPAGIRHRQVTVVFADVVGSTAMAHGMDAEDALDVLGSAMERMAAVVERHQGRVLRFTGDGVKAAFGMDLAREDDAERAVRAGLVILQAAHELADNARQRHGLSDFAVRVGVHTGDVALGAGIDADNTAMGVAVNVAARMEQTAPPGGLRISHDTWIHVRGLFDVEPQPPLEVKGVDVPMRTYLVRAAMDRRVATVERGVQGLHTPMVGRQAELQQLLDSVARARQTRQLQAMTVIGDAGLGKSRLMRELLPALKDCQVIALRLQPDGALRPWGLLRSLLATQCGVADTDSAELARAKVQDGLSPWFGEQGLAQAQRIGQLSGLDFGASPHVQGLDPRSLRDQALAALRSYLRTLAARGAALPVLLVEDLHWADDSSLDLLEHLRAFAAELPLALLMTARNGLLTRRPAWGTDHTALQLGPLAAAEGDALARALMQRIVPLPEPLAALVVGRAEGNPYYMEELVRRLIDDGVVVVGEPHWTAQLQRLDTVRLPGTLVGLLQARLDALPVAERQAARHASVVGPVFWDDALLAVDAAAPQALPALQRAAFVHPRRTSDFEGTPERQFDHHLLHQVTYDTLMKAERRLGHSAVARWLAERTQGRGAEFLAMTGEHAERAGETALAIDCFEQAGKEAQKRFANSAATAFLRRAQVLLGESEPRRRLDLLDRVTNIADFVGDRTQQAAAIEDRAALLERHPDDTGLASLRFARALLADRLSDAAASERLAREAFEMAERCGAAMIATLAQGQLAMLQRARETPLQVIAHLEIGLTWAARIEPAPARAHAEAQLLTLMGLASAQLGRFDEARTTLMAVLSRGEALGLPRLQLGALGTLAETGIRRGSWNEVADWAERMRSLAHAVGNARGEGDADACLAQVAEGRGDAAEAIRWRLQALAIYRAIGNKRMEALNLLRLGAAHLDAGDAASALPCLGQAQELYQGLDEPVEAGTADALAAQCQCRIGQANAARQAIDAVLKRFGADFLGRPAHDTLDLRWCCLQVLEALGDDRAAGLLERLHHDMMVRAAALAPETDRERLIDALPIFRQIKAAHARPHGGNSADDQRARSPKAT